MVRITVCDMSSKREVIMEVNPNDTIAAIIENAISYWKKFEKSKYIVKLGSKILDSKLKLKDVGLKSGAILELLGSE
ncbi:MAG: hypothetical protein AB1485_03220 [Candidatus Thermoplasmatota archaeon]